MNSSEIISVIGLGYVGLPVAIALSEHYETHGVDVSFKRIAELTNNIDVTGEVTQGELQLHLIEYITKPKDATFHIVTVPTPIDEANKPDLTCLHSATKAVGEVLKAGDLVVYESTVYPGLTEELGQMLEDISGLDCGSDFHLGYSPERVNPGDKDHTFRKTKKVISAQDKNSLDRMQAVYGSVVEVGLYIAPSIKVAEAAKVIENTQRDLNIALINELSIIFSRMGIDTLDVLEAAGSKWNFLPFRPGLVGGHCIGVDPYYLTYKAETLGYIPQVILAGRRINDGMGEFIANTTIKLLAKKGVNISQCSINILGITFKENCPDVRNSKVIDVVRVLEEYGVSVHVSDPHADPILVKELYGIDMELKDNVDATIIAVGHDEYKGIDLPNVIDVKGILPKDKSIWRL